MSLSRAVALRLTPKPMLLPVARKSMPLQGIPGRTGLVPGTIGRRDLGATAKGFGKLWVVEQPWRMSRGRYRSRARVVSIGTRSHRIIGQPIIIGRGASGIAPGAGSLWVVNSGDATVSRIDPRSHRVIGTISIGGRNLNRVVVSHGSVWVVDDDYDTSRGGQLIRIDAATNRVVGRTFLGKNMCGMFDLAVGLGSLWVTADSQGRVLRIDPATGKVIARIPVKGAPIAPIVVQGMIWVANEGQGVVREWRIDPSTNQASQADGFTGLGWRLVPAAGRVWTTDGATISMIDPQTATVELSMALPNTYDFTIDRNTLWAVSGDASGTNAVRWVDLRVPPRSLDSPVARVA
jgi:DNA-binding beta-propeller fold protein YncE